MLHIICISSLLFQDWSGIVDQSQAGGDQYHVGDFIYVMPAESTGNVSDVKLHWTSCDKF
jgi:hypothetical protein